MKQHHKYLNDLGIESTTTCIFNTSAKDKDRDKRFKKQRYEYGFDDRETWSLDYTLATWLYSHLKMYLEIGGEIVDLEFYKFDIPVLEDIPEEEYEYFDDNSMYPKHYQREVIAKDVTQKDAIDIAIGYLAKYITEQDTNEDDQRATECGQCALKIVATILPALWW